MRALLRIRFPDDVRDYLYVRAKNNDRSMNAEITNIMKKVMKAEPIKPARASAGACNVEVA